MVATGAFRQDLFFRLNVVQLAIPALKERPEDIPLLLDMALDRFNKHYGKKIRGFDSQVLTLLLDHPYPGNVRELLNIVERAAILCRTDQITIDLLPADMTLPVAGNLHHLGGRPKIELLQGMLARHAGNRSALARELGVNRTTLWRWLKELDLN